MKHVIQGVLKFRREVLPGLSELFDRLALAQSPDVMFITCSDSRIDPNLITQSNPGKLFICRNAGNIVPPHQYHAGGMTASIEYAVQALKIKDVIICGHYGCGAMSAALNVDSLKDFPHALDWLKLSHAAVSVVQHKHPDADAQQQLDLLCERNVVLQMQHLATHPYIDALLRSSEIDLHGWIYDVGSGMVKAYNSANDEFLPVEEHYAGSRYMQSDNSTGSTP